MLILQVGQEGVGAKLCFGACLRHALEFGKAKLHFEYLMTAQKNTSYEAGVFLVGPLGVEPRTERL